MEELTSLITPNNKIIYDMEAGIDRKYQILMPWLFSKIDWWFWL